MVTRAFTFPGQGSQAVGMGKELAEAYPEARAVFDEVDEALGQKLSAIMFDGPDETLRLTENAQPALMAVSMAVMRVLEGKGVTLLGNAAFVAGHSLGEYTALCAAGVFSLADAARLLKTRGRAMQQAVPVGQGAMAAILGLDLAAVEKVAAEAAAEGGVCAVANDNAPGQVVISGHAQTIERAIGIAKVMGAKRALPLPVSAPFHCVLMEPAAAAMEEALAGVEMQEPVVPLVANVLARPITDRSEIRERLVEQVTAMVRWTESVHWMTTDAGVDHLIELGTGKVLTGLAKRIAPEAQALAVNTPADLDAFAAAVAGA